LEEERLSRQPPLGKRKEGEGVRKNKLFDAFGGKGEQ